MELFFGPGNQSVLMCAQTSSCHPAGGEKEGEKVFVESRVEAGYGICLLQMCLPCSLYHWGPKAEAVHAHACVRHLGFFLGKQFYAKIRTVKNTLLCFQQWDLTVSSSTCFWLESISVLNTFDPNCFIWLVHLLCAFHCCHTHKKMCVHVCTCLFILACYNPWRMTFFKWKHFFLSCVCSPWQLFTSTH